LSSDSIKIINDRFKEVKPAIRVQTML